MEWLVTSLVDVLLALADAVQSPALGAVLTALGLGAVLARIRPVVAAVADLVRVLGAIRSGSSSNNLPPEVPSPVSPSEASPPTARKRQSSKLVTSKPLEVALPVPANDNRPVPPTPSEYPDQNGG